MNKKFVHAMNGHLNVVAKKDIRPIKFTIYCWRDEEETQFNFLFISIWCLKVDLWQTMKVCASYCNF
jgi:hypothetical protein